MQKQFIKYNILALLYLPPPPLFQLKLVYSYVIEVAYFESDLGLQGKALVSEILLFYHLLKCARGRSGHRGHVHLNQKLLSKFLNNN